MKQYSTYLFDLDGTITDTMAVWFGIFHDLLLEFGVTPPDEKTLAQYTHDWSTLVHVGLPASAVAAFTERAHILAKERLPDASFHEDAWETLTELKKRGKRLGIFSTMDREMFEPVMQHRNLSSLVEVAIAGTDVPHRKPHPAGIVKALEDLGIAKESYDSVVYVGDKDTDIQAANSAGVDGILYYPTQHHHVYDLAEYEKHHPAFVIRDWRELLR
jgi:phosphoglycolate phosphatase